MARPSSPMSSHTSAAEDLERCVLIAFAQKRDAALLQSVAMTVPPHSRPTLTRMRKTARAVSGGAPAGAEPARSAMYVTPITVRRRDGPVNAMSGAGIRGQRDLCSQLAAISLPRTTAQTA